MLKTLMVRSALIGFICSVSYTAYAMADAPKRIDIPAGELVVALETLSRQAAVDLVFQPDQLKSFRTEGVSGTYSPEDAIRLLLKGTPLQLRTDASSGAMVIAPSAAPKTSSLWSRLRFAQSSSASLSQGEGQGEDSTTDSEVTTGEDREQAESQRTQDPAQPQEAIALEEIVVTGTSIRGVAPAGSPLTVYTQQQIERTGVGSVSEFLKRIPQNLANVDGYNAQLVGGSSDVSYNTTGGTSVNLRGLGSGATLTLLNGHRIAAAGLYGTTPDVSVIPLGAIERIEVLGDGASSIYGADAIAGVVNFVLRRDYDGAEVGLRFGDSTQGGGQEFSASGTVGHAWSSGSALISYERYILDPYYFGDRDLEANALVDDEKTTLGPSQRRHSIFLTADRRFGERSELSGDAFYSERRYAASAFNTGVALLQSGKAESAGVNLAFTRGIGATWQVKATANVGRVEDDLTNEASFDGVPSDPGLFRNHAQLYGADLSADGALLPLAGGNLRLSFGVGARREQFVVDAVSTVFEPNRLSRSVVSAYGELAAPIVTELNAGAVHRLELSLSARYDHYDDFGSAVSPKVGVTFAPVEDISLRASFAHSFRAPPLNALTDRNHTFYAFPLVDPQAPGGITNTVFDFSSGNPSLKAERSRSFTAGFDLHPRWAPQLGLAATYFRISYEDRVNSLPFPDNDVFGVFSSPGAYEAVAPFVQIPADPALVAAAYADRGMNNPFGIDSADVGAYVDARFQNIGRSLTKGVDLAVNYDWDLGSTTFSPFASLSYLLASDFQAIATTPVISNLNQVGLPTDFRGRAGFTYTAGSWSVTTTVNYADRYLNRTGITFGNPETTVKSWTTLDLQLAYSAGSQHSGIFKNLKGSLNVLNALDTDPPPVAGSPFAYGFDAANASALGRFISLQLLKSW